MAEPVTRIQLIPVDTVKGYPPWGRVKEPATPTSPEKIEFTTERLSDSSRFRETNGPFESEAIYEIEITLPGYPEPFKSRATGLQLNMGNPNTERQANYPFAQIGQLPIYYRVTTPLMP